MPNRRPSRPPRGKAWKGPQIPRRLFHDFERVSSKKEFNQEDGGFWGTVSRTSETFKGVIMPLNNEDLERLPEGTSTTNSQKIYTNGDTLAVGQFVRDTLDGKEYSVTTELTHTPVHGLKRYVVQMKGVASVGK